MSVDVEAELRAAAAARAAAQAELRAATARLREAVLAAVQAGITPTRAARVGDAARGTVERWLREEQS